LSKIAKNLFFFFCSSCHVPDFSVNEQYLQRFPTLALVNIAQTQKKYNIPYSGANEEVRKILNFLIERKTTFLCPFLFVYLFIVCSF
jgi:hypothetical protein